MLSTTSHLMTLSIRHDSIIDRRTLRNTSLDELLMTTTIPTFMKILSTVFELAEHVVPRTTYRRLHDLS
jgi:hypothetical protein